MNHCKPHWPLKYPVLGVGVTSTTYEGAVSAITAAAREGRTACVTALAVHGLVTASDDEGLARALNAFEMVTPDGQPLRWALNRLYKAGLDDRVYGPELMLKICREAANEGIRIYLYGSEGHVVDRLRNNLLSLFPGLLIAGSEPSLFRPLTAAEDQALTERIKESGARILFVGLGCPLQERFAHEHRNRLEAVQVCVGAAFDFHSGNKKMAPQWMQRSSLEWLYRLLQEPRRLGRRYLTTNTLFVAKLLPHLILSGKTPKKKVADKNGGSVE